MISSLTHFGYPEVKTDQVIVMEVSSYMSKLISTIIDVMTSNLEVFKVAGFELTLKHKHILIGVNYRPPYLDAVVFYCNGVFE